MVLSVKVKAYYLMCQAAEEKSEDEIEYDMFIVERLPYIRKLDTINSKIKWWMNKSYFKLDDWLLYIWQLIYDNGWYPTDIDYIARNFPKQYVKEIINYLLKNMLEAPDFMFLDEKEFWLFERYEVSSDMLRQAQIRMIKTINQLLSNTEDRDAINTGCDILKSLISQSKTFSKDFLIRLAKHYGVENHIAIIDPAHQSGQNIQQYIKNLDSKKVLDKYDISVLFFRTKHFNKDQFLNIITRANDTAKEYIRGFLYVDSSTWHEGGDWTKGELFMLTEDLMPINIDFKIIKWPSNIWVSSIRDLDEDKNEQHRWVQMFSDFKIVPN